MIIHYFQAEFSYNLNFFSYIVFNSISNALYNKLTPAELQKLDAFFLRGGEYNFDSHDICRYLAQCITENRTIFGEQMIDKANTQLQKYYPEIRRITYGDIYEFMLPKLDPEICKETKKLCCIILSEYPEYKKLYLSRGILKMRKIDYDKIAARGIGQIYVCDKIIT